MYMYIGLRYKVKKYRLIDSTVFWQEIEWTSWCGNFFGPKSHVMQKVKEMKVKESEER